MKQVLTIAGSDSGGGAGIQADLKAFHANGVYGVCAITSVTAQNTCEVRAAYDLPVEMIRAQIGAVYDDFDVAAVKTGMLSSQVIVDTVVDELSERRPPFVVVDPVMISTSGFKLLQDDAIASVKAGLIPLAAVVTPNRHEAELLTGRKIQTRADAADAAKAIAELGAQAVVVKGGHLLGEEAAVDVLWDGDEIHEFTSVWFDTTNTHGTGCTFSSAIAAYLARGLPLKDAVGKAKTYITEAIRHGLQIGKGHGPTHHFYFLDGI